MLRISNHTACRFAEKARFFRSLWAGRRCAAASRFTFFKAKTLYTESADEQADGRYAARISAGRLCAFTPHAAGECVSRCLRRACKAIPENVVVYFAGERKGGTRRFPELFRLFTLRGKEPLCSNPFALLSMSVRLLRRLTDTACGRPLGRCSRQKGVPSPSNSPILPKTRTPGLTGKDGLFCNM